MKNIKSIELLSLFILASCAHQPNRQVASMAETSLNCTYKNNPHNTAEVVFQSPYHTSGDFMALDTHYSATQGWHFTVLKTRDLNSTYSSESELGSAQFEADLAIRNRGQPPLILKNLNCFRDTEYVN